MKIQTGSKLYLLIKEKGENPQSILNLVTVVNTNTDIIITSKIKFTNNLPWVLEHKDAQYYLFTGVSQAITKQLEL